MLRPVFEWQLSYSLFLSFIDQRTHVIREEKADAGDVAAKNKSAHRARRSIFAGDSAVEFAEVDVNDPDFWKKVLPDLVILCPYECTVHYKS